METPTRLLGNTTMRSVVVGPKLHFFHSGSVNIGSMGLVYGFLWVLRGVPDPIRNMSVIANILEYLSSVGKTGTPSKQISKTYYENGVTLRWHNIFTLKVLPLS